MRYWVFIVVASLSSCSSCTSPSSHPKTEFTIASPYELTPLHPILSVDGFSSNLLRLVSDGLVEGSNGDYLIAESIETSDAKTWKIKIRPNIQFHDGSIISSKDVINSIEIARRFSKQHHRWDELNVIQSIQELSPLELEVKLSEPMVTFRKALFFGILPAKYFRLDNDSKEAFIQNPIASGPFQLKKFSPHFMEFERFPSYFQGKPQLQHIYVKYFPTKEEAWVQFAKGKADLVSDSFSDVEGLKAISKDLTEYTLEPPFGYALCLQTRKGPLADRNVRRAFAHAIDRRHFHELSKEIDDVKAPWIPANENWGIPVGANYDPAEARRLLKNKKLSFRMFYFSSDEFGLRISRWIAENLEDVGIATEIVPGNINDVRKKMSEESNAGILHYYPPQNEPNRLRDLFHSSQIENGYNCAGYNSPDVDQLLDNARREVDTDVRERFYKKVITRIEEDQPSIFLFWRKRVLPMNDCWKGTENIPRSLLATIWKWHCP